MVEGSECNYTDNFNIGGVATDPAGNIYVSGLYRTTINFGEKANFTTARNAATWQGDPQEKRGDIFVVKLDDKGEAIWGVTSSGDPILYENPKATVVKGDKIYLTGVIQGNPASKVKLGDMPVQVTEKQSLFVACMSKETGAFEWVKVLESKNNAGCNKAYAKPMNINVDGNNIYLSGSFQGDMLDGANTILSSKIKKLHGYVIKCNAQDGSVVAAVETTSSNKNDILETEAVHAIGNKVFALGYGLMTNSYLYVYDENLTPESKQEFIVKKSFFGSTGGAAFVDDNIVNMTRMKNTATIPGATGTIKTVVYNGNNNWGCLYTCHSISDFISMLKLDDDVNYEGAEEKNCDLAIYKRNFTHTKWQSLYLPFDMKYEDWCGMFEVARINDVHEFDDNNDGVIDRTQLEVIILGEGAKTEANVPYMFKAKATGIQKLSAADVFVKPAAPYEHDVTSWNTRFIFHGTYDGVTGDDMFNNKYYAFADGGLKQVSQPVPMKGYRWYLDIQDRAGEKLPTAKAISLRIVDEEGNVTGVEEVELDGNAAAGNGYSAGVYNLQGQKVRDNADDLVGLPKGVYIINGKKVIL